MKKAVGLIALLSLSGCVSTPEIVTFNGATVGTYSVSAGCGTLGLDKDCSQISGATKNIDINGIKLRISGGNEGKTVFLMSMPKFTSDENALQSGAKAIEEIFSESGLEIETTKVMYGGGTVFGVHYTLSGDGYSLLDRWSV